MSDAALFDTDRPTRQDGAHPLWRPPVARAHRWWLRPDGTRNGWFALAQAVAMSDRVIPSSAWRLALWLELWRELWRRLEAQKHGELKAA